MYFVSTDIYIRTFVSSSLQHKRFCHTFTSVQIILFRTSKHTEDYQTRTTCEFMNKKYLNKSIRKKLHMSHNQLRQKHHLNSVFIRSQASVFFQRSLSYLIISVAIKSLNTSLLKIQK